MADADDEQVPWLDDAEQAAWMAFMATLMLLPRELDRQLQRDSDMGLMEYSVMAGLSEAPERTMRMSTIAMWTGAQLPRLSQVAARMESRGWLVRSPDPTDGRYTLATLTDEGYAAIVAAAPEHVRNVRRLVLDRLTAAQVRQLGTVASRILQGIHPDQAFPPPAGA